MMYFQAFVDIGPVKDGFNRRMFDLIYMVDVFDVGINDTVLVFKKLGKPSTTYVAIFIDGGSQNGAAIFTIPGGIISAATKERDSEGGSCNDHS